MKKKRQNLYVGTAGWAIPRLLGEQFPGEGPHLERYGRVFRCAEINSTFYRPPLASTWLRWRDAVPEGFQFSVKAPRAITHDAGLAVKAGTRAELGDFLAAAQRLGGALGPILFQLPPKLVFDPARAETFFALFRSMFGGLAALEPRNASWFEADAERLLMAHGVARVAADPARVPAAGGPGGWPGLVYYRLHGSPRMYYSEYGEAYLLELAKSMEEGKGEREVWVVFDNTASGAAASDALSLRTLLKLG